MRDIYYTVHTSANPMDPDASFLLIRKRRPRGLDYALMAERLHAEFGDRIHAIYEDRSPELDDLPKFETNAHAVNINVLKAERVRIQEMTRPLYQVSRFVADLKDDMEGFLQREERIVQNLKADLSHFEAATKLDPEVADLSHITGSFVGNAIQNGGYQLESIVRRQSELAYCLAQCHTLIMTVVAARKASGESDCCENSYYEVEPNLEHRWDAAKVKCVICGDELEIPESPRMPKAELVQVAA